MLRKASFKLAPRIRAGCLPEGEAQGVSYGVAGAKSQANPSNSISIPLDGPALGAITFMDGKASDIHYQRY